jgi:hypothetical protein
MTYRERREVSTEQTRQHEEKEETPDKVHDFKKLRAILSRSSACDVYCRSALYFAFTGRGKVWTVKHENDYLILLRHPNIFKVLLVFFPFVSDILDLVEQVKTLCNCKSFLSQFQEVHLARIPDTVATNVKKAGHNRLPCVLELIDEVKLDWAYPSFDVCLTKLANPAGNKLATYRKKIRKFNDRDVEVIRPKQLDPLELRNAVIHVTKKWIRTKSRSANPLEKFGFSPRELMAPYRALARLNSESTLEMDGLILKRGGAYVAFSIWECPTKGDIVPCVAALPCSYERGLSEFLYYCIARQLEDEGYDRMCIGGSETPGLDQFKQKLDPIESHRLWTMKLPHCINGASKR